MKDIEFYIAQAKQKGFYDERGQTKYCFIFDDCVLLYAPHSDLNSLAEQKPHIDKLADEGHKTPRILGFKYQDDCNFNFPDKINAPYGFVLEERAKGEPIHNKETRNFHCFTQTNKSSQEMYDSYIETIGRYAVRMKEIANLPREQITQYVDTIIKLMTSPTTPLGYDDIGDNCIFDPKEGISFIDLGYKQNNEKEKVMFTKHTAKYVLDRLFDNPPEKSGFKMQKNIGRPLKLAELSKYGTSLNLGFPPEWVESVSKSYQTILDKITPALLANGCSAEQIEQYTNGYPDPYVPGHIYGGLAQRLGNWKRQVKPTKQIKLEIDTARKKLLSQPIEAENLK